MEVTTLKTENISLKNTIEDLRERVRFLESQTVSPSETVDPTSSPRSKRRKEELCSIAPSSIKWMDLVSRKIIGSFDLFVLQCSDKAVFCLPAEVNEKYEERDALANMYHILLNHGTPSSEGYSMLIVGLFIAIAAKMAKMSFNVFPAVYLHPTDSRKNKYA